MTRTMSIMLLGWSMLSIPASAVTSTFRFCETGEIGDWAVVAQGRHAALVLSSKAYEVTVEDVCCQVPSDAKILVLDAGKPI